MAAVIEAAGNLVFQLIMNSVRELYLPHAELFTALVARREQLLPLYAHVAETIEAGDADAAATATAALAEAQEARMAGGA